MGIPKLIDLKGPQLTEKHFKFHYKEFLDYLNEKYSNELSFSEKLYWYYNDLKDYPVCKVCGNRTNFINAKEGYREYCSRKCLNSDPSKKEKVKQTCIEKFGGIAPACSKEVREKQKQTNIERYGAENAMQNQDIANKSHQTNIERYGGCGNASKILLEKQKQTNIERYGVENVMNNDTIKNKMKTSRSQTLKDHYEDIMNKIIQSRQEAEINKHDGLIGYTDDGDWMCKCPHPECNKCKEKYYIVKPQIYHDRYRDHTEPCTRLLPIGSDGTKNTSIEIFIRNILDQYNIEYETNDRSVLDGKELDIYIPSKHIAIECNGIYWHSTIYRDSKYHYNKFIKCKEKGIQLLTIWEDQIINKPQILRSIVLSKLGIYNTRLYARKCVIREVNSKISKDFLNDNHLQGNVNSAIKLGLYYNDELVSLMTFGSKRKCMNSVGEGYELYRYCNKLGIQVVGGASRLFKHFIKQYNPSQIESFSSNDISNGSLYKILNFDYIDSKFGSYWYIDSKLLKRYHRYKFRKSELIKMGADANLSESQIMNDWGYYKIFDTGQSKWIWKNL